MMQAKPILRRGKVTQMLDPRLGDEYDVDQAERIALAAALCIKRAPRSRPRMDFVSLPIHLHYEPAPELKKPLSVSLSLLVS